MEVSGFKCSVCQMSFSLKSNLTRHMQLHTSDQNKCNQCGKTFGQKQGLLAHMKGHRDALHYPQIRLYRQGEAKLLCTDAANTVALTPSQIDPLWLDGAKAEAAAKKAGGDMWEGHLVLTFGKYSGQTFKWLLENDVGWVVWLLAEYCQKGEPSDHLRLQKERLLNYTRQFAPVSFHLDKRLQQSRKEGERREHQDPNYTTDAELLALAEQVLDGSEVPVSTQLTTWGELRADPDMSGAGPSTSQSVPSQVCHPSSDAGGIVLEGWQKYWENPPPSAQAQGMALANIKWLKEDEVYGLYQQSTKYKNARGETAERKSFRVDKMDFQPPPYPAFVKGGVPNMLAFFTTPAFFWRPVGVMQAKIRCPNSDCPAPPGAYLEKKGFGTYARQVCGPQFNYTLLTERLLCVHCQRSRQVSKTLQDSDDEDCPQLQEYVWRAYSPKILFNLAPAIRNLFPAILCGRRAIDRYVVTTLNDRINSASMAKVHRVLQQDHDRWYTCRVALYQTLLFNVQTEGAASSQKGILPFFKPAGTFTPPLPPYPLPSARVLRRAHMIMEMEKMPTYRASILSVTGEILCIDGTRKILKKIYGEGQGSMQYVTSVLNEWGQFLTTVVVAAESEGCYRRMAKGLMARFERANAPAPRVIYADNNCCRASGSSFLEKLFLAWVEKGTVVRLDIRHWLHRWDAVVIKQSHVKYGLFMSSMAGAVLAYNSGDMLRLIQAVRKGNEDRYRRVPDEAMIRFLKPHQISSYVRRVTRGVQETAQAVHHILAEFKGPAGLDIDGIPLFKSAEAVEAHWATSSKHISCMQDPPGVQLYVSVKEVVLNGVTLNRYKCRRGSNALEGLHAHMYNGIPSQRCGVMPFQVYLIAFAVQWNNRMESLRVAGGRGRLTSCVDAREIQRLNQQAEVLFGKEHLIEPNFTAPMPLPAAYEDPEEEELLGVEYAMCQSTDFTPKRYYAQKVEEEQTREDDETTEQEEQEEEEKEEEEADEGVDVSEEKVDPVDTYSEGHATLTNMELVEEEDSPALQDTLNAGSNFHLPGLEEVQALAILLVQLVDDGDCHLIPAGLRDQISTAARALHDHDKSAVRFVKEYESRWGYTLFGRCMGADTPETRAAQKTKFAWMRYPQAAQVTDDSRLLYLTIKMLKNRPPANHFTSPGKICTAIKSQYKRIVDRVRDDPILDPLGIPLPNINAKSVSTFLSREEKKANFKATATPHVTPHRRVLCDDPLPEAPTLPPCLTPPDRPQAQYPVLHHEAGERPGQKRRINIEEPQLGKRAIFPKPGTSSSMSSSVSEAPVLVIVPSQPQAPSMVWKAGVASTSFAPFVPPPAPPPIILRPNKSTKPCGACNLPQCGGLRKRYTPSKDKTAGSSQKIFTFCPTTNRSMTPGFEGVVYDGFEDFKRVVDERLRGRTSQ